MLSVQLLDGLGRITQDSGDASGGSGSTDYTYAYAKSSYQPPSSQPSPEPTYQAPPPQPAPQPDPAPTPQPSSYQDTMSTQPAQQMQPEPQQWQPADTQPTQPATAQPTVTVVTVVPSPGTQPPGPVVDTSQPPSAGSQVTVSPPSTPSTKPLPAWIARLRLMPKSVWLGGAALLALLAVLALRRRR